MYYQEGETRRLKIRKLEKPDILLWEEFFTGNKALPWLGLDLNLSPSDQSADWIQKQFDSYQKKRFGLMTLIEKDSGVFIGQSGLISRDVKGNTEIEIACHILPKFWGHGYASEAARYFRDYAFKNEVCESLVSIIDHRNKPSQGVAVKNGFKKDSELKINGSELFIFRLNKTEWNPES